MKNTTKRALYIIAALLAALFVLSCLVGFAACGGGSGSTEDGGDNTPAAATVSNVTISGDASTMTEGDTATLTASVTMSDGGNYSGSYLWSTSDSSVVSLSAANTVSVTATAVAAGNATITLSVDNSKSATYEIAVSAAPAPTVTGVSLNEETLAFEYGSEAKSSDLTATVTMSDGSDYEGDYTWTSSNESVATVSADTDNSKATVTAVKCGTATVTVSVGEDDNVKTAECEVTVSEDHVAAEAARITGSADAAEGYNFTFDDAEAVEAGSAVLFNDSSVSATYDASAKTYTLSGLSVMMTSEQSTAFWGADNGSAHMGHRYIGFIVNVNEGETIDVTTYTGEDDETKEKDVTFSSSDEDTSFIMDLEDHGSDGDWRMVLDVTYAGGDEKTYTVVIGDVETGVAAQETIQAAGAEGGEVILATDIDLVSAQDDDASGSRAVKQAATLYIGDDDGTEVELTLDLNGHTLARHTLNSSGYQYNTIIVKAGATLTIMDSSEDGSGVVDCTGMYNTTIVNYGTLTLAGGLITRSQEDGSDESSHGTDSAYTIENQGTMTIEDGATVFNAGDYSTCVRSKGASADSPAKLTMTGGKVYGGKYAVGSGSSGYEDVFVMTGGTLGGLRDEDDTLPYRALNNYCNATITGGKLLGGNGGAIAVGGAGKPDACVEGVVIFNEDTGSQALTIGNEDGSGPEIIYEGVNHDTALRGDFAAGIAIYSGTVNFKGGTISCDGTEPRPFVGAYLTGGTLKATGGKISGIEAAIVVNATEGGSATVTVNGCLLEGAEDIHTVTDTDREAVLDRVIVPSESFTFNDGSFDGLSGLTEDFTGTSSGTEYKAGDIAITETLESDGSISVVVDGIVANKMTDDQKTAFDASYSSDQDGTIRFYVAFEIAVQPGETVSYTTSGEKTETVANSGDETMYMTIVVEVLNPSGEAWNSCPSSAPSGSYGVVTLNNFYVSVEVEGEDGETTNYTITFGNIFIPQSAWTTDCGD